MRTLLYWALVALLVQPTPSEAQGSDGRAKPPSEAAVIEAPVVPRIRALPVGADAVRIDGVLDDEAWRDAPVARDFVQLRPDEGRPATERTEVRLLYGPTALYVGVYAYDSQPDSIVGQLTRRDQDSYSDRVNVLIDSYNDGRTAFHFAVNPRGVKQDQYRFDDVQGDIGWNAVWDVATRMVENGWTAEFRLPYSQLRFGREQVQRWGINFTREIARRNEESFWAPVSAQDNALVSKFGRLEGIEDIARPRRLELQPYSLARVTRAPGDPDDPFYDETARFSTVGVDVKLGITSNLTLDVTLNPDFGQVEADPARLNLSAFETFQPEQRPFFMEGWTLNFTITTPGTTEASVFILPLGKEATCPCTSLTVVRKLTPQTNQNR